MLSAPENNWYILPDNTAYLIFYMIRRNGLVKPSLRLIGPRSRHLIINRHNREFTFMVSFKPAGISAFSRVPVSEFCDISIEAHHVFKPYQPELLQQLGLLSVESNLAPFIKLMESFLRSSLLEEDSFHPAIGQFIDLSQKSAHRLSDISDQIGISDRQLRSLSKKYIGHRPKSVLQIERFTKSLKYANTSHKWSHIAHDCGYFDQSHLIASYQKMTGSSPEKLFR
jgi:AraC-like DNA-binding protein